MNVALLLAGGIGKRAETPVPKQFLEVNSIPVIVYTLRVFQQSDDIDGICIVSHPEWKKEVRSYAKRFGISKLKWIANGGRTGLESVKNGLETLSELQNDTIILIHDSVRPFLTQKTIVENIITAKKHGVAVTSVPCVETLVKADSNGKAEQQIPRDGLMRVMTPQSFRIKTLREIFADVDVLNSPYPSTFALYMSKGYPVFCSYGSERNIKITYSEDIEYLKALFNN